MKNYLLLISCLLLFPSLISYCANITSDICAEENEYQIYMQFRGQEITGICLINRSADNQIVGSVINEFGVKAFDFMSDGYKTKLLNVIKPLNKWYIRKVLKGDFNFIIQNIKQNKDVAIKKRRITFLSDGDIVVHNEKYKIRYTFTPIKDNNETVR